jgi:hypothetical protein
MGHGLPPGDHLQRCFLDFRVIEIDLALALQYERGRGAVPVRIGADGQMHLLDDQRAHGDRLHVQRRQVAIECARGVAFETQDHDQASRSDP